MQQRRGTPIAFMKAQKGTSQFLRVSGLKVPDYLGLHHHLKKCQGQNELKPPRAAAIGR